MKKRNVILIHVAVWALLLMSNFWTAYTSPTLFKNEQDIALKLFKCLALEGGYLLIPVFCFYAAYGWVAPSLFVSKQYPKALAWLVLSFAGAVMLRYLLEYYFFLPVLGFDNYRGQTWPVAEYMGNVFFYYFPRYFVYGLMYFFGENWYRTRHLQQSLEKERAAAELALLRSQINPHFLFNAINDIYSLSYYKSDQAPVALLKLSEILRYTLHESKTELTGLIQEIKYIENVIELQRISAKGNICISFSVDGDVDTQRVPSLLLIIFVENAFKHGIINEPQHPITITLNTTGNEISFMVKNKKGNFEKDRTGGIGLGNAKRRLELLAAGKYSLFIDETDTHYTVSLILSNL